MIKQYSSHGSGEFSEGQFSKMGENVIFERGVLVFHPENISLGSNVYVGHNSILKGYFENKMEIGDNTWIGQNCFFHSAGGISIGKNVGVGPGVQIITSSHSEEGRDKPILFSQLKFAPVFVGDDVDLGVGTVILPGVKIGKGVQVGAGSVVTADVPDYAVVAGVPAKVIRYR